MRAETYTACGTESFACLAPALREQIARVKMLILDVDGVLTDGGLYYVPEGHIAKRFNVQDGFGIQIARQSGLHLAVVTGQDQPSVAARMRDLRIEDYFPGCVNKGEALDALCRKRGVSREEIAFLGDDWIDLSILEVVGVPLAVANAVPEVLRTALYITGRSGGDGAVREAIRLILYCKGTLDAALADWMAKHNP
ncbi:hypothetical protein FACS1894206_07400 [Deltaproteobacteria bacterium]|nr:hypothetical protein FACS1894206_07400 [Deltaproteobacteria bacterium]